MDKLRAEFEKRFPVPECLEFLNGEYRYKTNGEPCYPYSRQWDGYQACAESLRAELAAEQAANAKVRNPSVFAEVYVRVGDRACSIAETEIALGLSNLPQRTNLRAMADRAFEQIFPEIRALGKAVSVQRELSDDELMKSFMSATGIFPASHQATFHGIRAVIAADRKLRDGLMR